MVLLAVSWVAGLGAGSVTLSPLQVWQGLVYSGEGLERRIVWDLRLPRVLTGMLVGMCLAASGALLQRVMRNPLADPGIIGVSAGGGLMAVTTMILFPQHMGLLPAAAFLGALGAAALVYVLAWDGGVSPLRLILAGVAVNALLGAVTSGIMITHSDQVQSVLPWLTGGLAGRSWPHVALILPYGLPALLLCMWAAKPANLLRLDEDSVRLLGHRVDITRLLLTLLATWLAGAAVSVAGLVGFVGLVVPHMVRLFTGDDYRTLLPLSIVTGGLITVFADTAARTWFDPVELPVGILLAVIGTPFFLYLLRRGGSGYAQTAGR